MKTNLSKSHIKDTVTYKNTNENFRSAEFPPTSSPWAASALEHHSNLLHVFLHEVTKAEEQTSLSYFHQVPLTKQLQLFVLEFIICGKHCSITDLPGTDVTAVLLNTNKLVSLIPDDKRRQATPSTWLVVSNPHIASAASVGCPCCHVVIHQQLAWIRASLLHQFIQIYKSEEQLVAWDGNLHLFGFCARYRVFRGTVYYCTTTILGRPKAPTLHFLTNF